MISIDEAILDSQRRAKRFWLISIAWTIVMLVTASIIGISLYQFTKTQREINDLKITANQLIMELEKTKENLEQLRKTGSAQSRQIYALSLGPDKLTSEQKEFIKRQADEASKQHFPLRLKQGGVNVLDMFALSAYPAPVLRWRQGARDVRISHIHGSLSG